jgi:hypothetical protein
MGVEAGIPLMHQPNNSSHKELHELLLKPLHYHSLDVFILSESMAL